MKHIQSLQNTQVKQWKKLLTKKERQKTKTYLLEGFHLVEEAIQHKQSLLQLIFREDIALPENWEVSGIESYTVTQEIIDLLSDTETPQGVFAVCRMPLIEELQLEAGKYLLLDSIQDPGNLGTMIRTADAAGIDYVILGKGSTDLYNQKTLRSAQGSHFHINIHTAELDQIIPALQQASIPVYGTALENGVNFKEVAPSPSFALLLGNEGNGVSRALLEQTTKNLYIPIHGQSESLNVAIAAGILMYYLRG